MNTDHLKLSSRSHCPALTVRLAWPVQYAISTPGGLHRRALCTGNDSEFGFELDVDLTSITILNLNLTCDSDVNQTLKRNRPLLEIVLALVAHSTRTLQRSDGPMIRPGVVIESLWRGTLKVDNLLKSWSRYNTDATTSRPGITQLGYDSPGHCH
eukprot:2985657-Rhodomonas_salina.1